MTASIKKACKKLKLPELTFYEAGRHTFASQWVLNGGSIEKLREILGHSTVLVTERYAHLKPELFQEADLLRADVSLRVAG
jgi:site-specific recombinase XerD